MLSVSASAAPKERRVLPPTTEIVKSSLLLAEPPKAVWLSIARPFLNTRIPLLKALSTSLARSMFKVEPPEIVVSSWYA